MRTCENVRMAVVERLRRDAEYLLYLNDSRCSTDRGTEGAVTVDVIEDEVVTIALVDDYSTPEPFDVTVQFGDSDEFPPTRLHATVVEVDDTLTLVGDDIGDCPVIITAILEVL